MRVTQPAAIGGPREVIESLAMVAPNKSTFLAGLVFAALALPIYAGQKLILDVKIIDAQNTEAEYTYILHGILDFTIERKRRLRRGGECRQLQRINHDDGFEHTRQTGLIPRARGDVRSTVA